MTLTNRKYYQPYDYRIRAFNKYCSGPWSNTTRVVLGELARGPGPVKTSINR